MIASKHVIEFDVYKCLQVISSRKTYDILGLCAKGHLNERSWMSERDCQSARQVSVMYCK